MKSDFIEYPRRISKGDELCKCMHSWKQHRPKPKEYCSICMCEKFEESEMNGQLDMEIEKAKLEAESSLK